MNNIEPKIEVNFKKIIKKKLDSAKRGLTVANGTTDYSAYAI